MRNFFEDLRYGVRILRGTPGISSVAVLTLALGIGANTAIFTVVRDVLLRPLPFAAADRIVDVTSFEPFAATPAWVSSPDFRDWRAQNHVFERLTAWDAREVNLTGTGAPERVPAMAVTRAFFPLLGVRPFLGRNFTEREDKPGGPRVVVVSHALWQRRLGGSADAIGRAISLDGAPFTIVGVMPGGFRFSNAMEDVWIPLQLDDADNYRGSTWLKVLGRLKPGVTVAQAQKEMTAIVSRISREFPENSTGRRVLVEPLHARLVRDVQPALITLFGIVIAVLLVACTNVANLLITRATARQREMAVRRALGASPARIVRQLLTESTLPGMLAGGLGFLMGWWGVRLLYLSIPASLVPVGVTGVDAPVFFFTLSLALATSVAFGLGPAWISSRFDGNTMLREGARSSGDAAQTRLRGVLVIAETAGAVVLLAAAGVLIRSFVHLAHVNPGFRPENVLTMDLSHRGDESGFYGRALDALRRLPGVIAVGATSKLPMTGSDWGQNLFPEGRPAVSRFDRQIFADTRNVSPGYFQAMGTGLLRGRLLKESDVGESRCVINEAMARQVWPNQDAIGKRFKIGDPRTPDTRPWVTVVGIVADTKRHGLTTAAESEMDFADFSPTMTIVMRTSLDPVQYARSAREAIRSIDPNQPVSNIRLLEQVVADSIAPQRITMAFGGLFAVLALLLAGTGLYSVMAHAIALRRHEIGIRMALGASPAQIVHLVLRQGMTLTGAGLATGLLAALAATRVLSRLLFEVSPHDPLILGAVTVLLWGVALFASYMPARNALAADPMTALRNE